MGFKRIGLKSRTTIDRFSCYVDMNDDFELEKSYYADISESLLIDGFANSSKLDEGLGESKYADLPESLLTDLNKN